MKQNIKKILSLFFISLICSFSYYAEVMIHGWEGLKWTGNFYWTLLVAPFIFCLWIKIFVEKEIKIKNIFKFLLSYFLTFIVIYILLNFLYNLRLTAFLLFVPFEKFITENIFDLLVYCTIVLNSALIFIILFLENLKLQKILNFELAKKEKIILVFQPIYIFFTAEIWMIVLYYLKAFPKMNQFDLFESIFIFKTGTIIFSSILFEGLYILYKKKV